MAVAILALVPTMIRAQDPAVIAAPWPDVSLGSSVTPGTAQPGTLVSYTDTLTNVGDVSALGVSFSHLLPSGFSYRSGTARIYRDGMLLGSTEPSIAGQRLTWSGLTVPARRGDSFYGINTMVQDRCEIGYISWQLDRVRELMGYGAWAKQLFYGIVASTNDPQPCWIDFIEAAYDRGLKPVIRLAGEHGGSFWHKPQADGTGNYYTVAQAFARVVAKLPRRDGHRLYIQIWNEPNLNLEWGNSANATEYGRFLEQTASAIRSATGGDPRVVIMNGPMSPGGNIAPNTFINDMFRTVPNSLWTFDIWASHSYPGNYPPELNIHSGQAANSLVTIDSYVPERQILANRGRGDVQVFLSETGYYLGQRLDQRYPGIDESNRADYISRAFQVYWRSWPELIGVAPYQLSDPQGTWGGWNWVEQDNSRHEQYSRVMELDKSNPFVSGQVTIKFQAAAGFGSGILTSSLSATASNTTIPSVPAVAPVYVAPTPTPPAAATPTATATGALIPTSTPTPDSAWSTNTPSPTPNLPPPGTPTPTATPVAYRLRTIQVGPQPHGLTIDAGHGLLYVASHTGGGVTALSVADSSVMRTYSLGPARGANGVAFDPVRSELLVANRDTDNVSRLSVASGEAREMASGAQPDGVAVNPTSGIAYVANFADNSIRLLDTSNGASLALEPVGGRPSFIALDVSRGRFYVTNHQGSTVGVHDLSTGATIKLIPTGGGPYGIALDEARRRLYTADRDGRSITIIDLDTDLVIKKMPLNCVPYQVGVNAASGHLFALCGDDQQLHVFDLVTTLWLGWVSVGRGAREGLAVDSATGQIFVSNSEDDSVTVIQDSGPRWTPTPLPTSAVGSTPTATLPWPTRTNTPSPTATLPPTSPATPTPTATPTLTPSPSRTPTSTPTPTASRTATPSPSPTPVVPGKPDRYEVDDTYMLAASLNPAENSQEHTFHLPADVDWVRLEAVAGDRYLFRAAPVKSATVVLTLFGADGRTALAESQPDLDGERAAVLSWRAVSSGAFYLEAREAMGLGGLGAFYTLSMETVSTASYLPFAQARRAIGLASAAALQLPDQETVVSAAALAADGGRLYLGDGRGVSAREADSGLVLARTELGQPVAELLSAPGRLFVGVEDPGRVLAVDPVSLGLLAESRPIEQVGGMARAGGWLWVADTAASRLYVLREDDLVEQLAVEVGPGPFGVVATSAFGRVFVGLTGSGDGVAMLESSTGQLMRVIALGGLGYPQAMVEDARTSRLYVLYQLAPRYRQIAVLDSTSGDLVDTIPATLDRTMSQASALCLDEERRQLIVAGAVDMMRLDLTTGRWGSSSAWDSFGPIRSVIVDARTDRLYAIQENPRAPGAARLLARARDD